jgi:membrane-associated phospholipid phosphatase
MPRRAAPFVAGAGAGIALLLVVWYAAFHVGFVRHLDQSILTGFGDLRQGHRVDSVANFIAGLCDPQPYVYFAAVPVIAALLRRRPLVALAIAAMLLGANVTTQLLKPLLAQPRPDALLGGSQPVAAASWPSGHATAAMSLAFAAVLAAPARWRGVAAAVGAAFAVAVSYSFLTLEWHYPSDVLGGFLVAATWTLFAIAAVLAVNTRDLRAEPGEATSRPSVRDALTPPAVALLSALALAAMVALVRPHAVVSYAQAHRAFMLGAGSIGLLALALATGLMLALRR